MSIEDAVARLSYEAAQPEIRASLQAIQQSQRRFKMPVVAQGLLLALAAAIVVQTKGGTKTDREELLEATLRGLRRAVMSFEG